MGYPTLHPEQLLGAGFSDPAVARGPWCVRWEEVVDPVALCAAQLPEHVDFPTSGSTGEPQIWRRRGEKVLAEAGLLAELLGNHDSVVSFVPTRHLFGALTSVLVPAWLGAPGWFREDYAGALPNVPGGRVAVMATPWIFRLLLQNPAWVGRFDKVTVLYGGAMLPDTAKQLLREAENADILEVLGSTEAGGIASRRWHEGEPPDWTLFPDVSFADPNTVAGEEVLLAVRGTRLAFPPGGSPSSTWTADDVVVPLGERNLRLVGRRGRLVKVNGRRINLDDAEHTLRATLDCADLALVPVLDDEIGEHVELRLVPHDGIAPPGPDLAAAFRRLGLRPKRVRVLDSIERSALGKATRRSNTRSTKEEVATS